jgi:hypothetical protein
MIPSAMERQPVQNNALDEVGLVGTRGIDRRRLRGLGLAAAGHGGVGSAEDSHQGRDGQLLQNRISVSLCIWRMGQVEETLEFNWGSYVVGTDLAAGNVVHLHHLGGIERFGLKESGL